MKEARRKIIHVDMDCFFAAVEVRDQPELQGKAVAVGGSAKRRGVIAAANYEARAFGVHSALSTAVALRRCPELILVHPQMSKYKAVSSEVFKVFRKYTQIIEAISLDEAFLDVSESPLYHGSGTLIAEAIKKEIFKETGLRASAGIAPNKFLAKIASDWMKPDGIYTISPDKVEKFVQQLPVKKIWGVGKETLRELRKFALETCADLQKISPDNLAKLIGSNRAEELIELAHGIDHSEVQAHRERKSYSRERTFDCDLSHNECKDALLTVFTDCKAKLELYLKEKPQYKIKTSVLKVKFADFTSTTVECADLNFEWEKLEALLLKALERNPLRVRLLGCGVKFTKNDLAQPDLF
jgi:DNA polymerase IV